jgi:hypothetical protein
LELPISLFPANYEVTGAAGSISGFYESPAINSEFGATALLQGVTRPDSDTMPEKRV